MFNTVLLSVFLLHDAVFLLHYGKNSAGRHKIRILMPAAALIFHVILLALLLMVPDVFRSGFFSAFFIFSLIYGFLLHTFNYMVFYKRRHIPVKADRKLRISELEDLEKETIPGENSFTAEAEDLLFIFPEYEEIRFLDHYADGRKNRRVTLSCAGALNTRQFGGGSGSIIGPFMIDGKLYRREIRTTDLALGAFLWSKDGYRFVPPDQAEEAFRGSEGTQGAIGFSQVLLIENGEKRKLFDIDDKKQCYRVLAEFHGKLVIVTGRKLKTFAEFMEDLSKTGLTNALFLDMGTWSNVSWYRDRKGRVRYCFPKLITRPANTLQFLKKDKQ